jgi:hypothetical protein
VSAAGWARSPRPATRTHAGCWSKRPGTSGGRSAPAQHSSGADKSRGKRRTIVAGRRRTRARRTLLGAGDDDVAESSAARRGERTGAKDARSDPRYSYEQPNGRRSTLESGSASHFADPVMRSRPAHISRDTGVDDSRCAPPAATKRPRPGDENEFKVSVISHVYTPSLVRRRYGRISSASARERGRAIAAGSAASRPARPSTRARSKETPP